MARVASVYPAQKVAAGDIAGAISIMLVWVTGQFANLHVLAKMASGFTMITTFLICYMVPPSGGETVRDLHKPP